MDYDDIRKVIRKVERFNRDLEAYAKVSGDYDLPEIDCTICGTSPVDKYRYEVAENEESILVYDGDGNLYEIEDIEYGVAYEEFLDALKYDRRRLSKAWRVFKSDNPDWELENDND